MTMTWDQFMNRSAGGSKRNESIVAYARLCINARRKLYSKMIKLLEKDGEGWMVTEKADPIVLKDLKKWLKEQPYEIIQKDDAICLRYKAA